MIIVVLFTHRKPVKVDFVGTTPIVCFDKPVQSVKRLQTTTFIRLNIQTTMIDEEEQTRLLKPRSVTNKWKQKGVIKGDMSIYLNEYTNLFYKKQFVRNSHSQITINIKKLLHICLFSYLFLVSYYSEIT